MDAKGLQLAQQKKAEYVVDIGVEQNRTGDGRVARAGTAARVEFGIGFDLSAQVRRGSQQKPGFRVGADRDLGLGTGLTMERSRADGTTVGAGAIPLRKASSGG